MTKKTMADMRCAKTEEAQGIAEMKDMLFTEAYYHQDTETRALIDKVSAELRKYHKSDLAEPWLAMSLNWLAMELVKDMAMAGIRLGNFKFASGICAACGRED